MKTLLRAIILVPVAVTLISFALANRTSITLRLDPFDILNPPPTIDVPLFLPIFVGMIVGILLGGGTMWISQGRHRRTVRMHLRTIELQRRQLDERTKTQDTRQLPPASFIG